MKFSYILFAIPLFLSNICISQIDKQKTNYSPAFVVIDDNRKYVLPDSLGGKSAYGNILLNMLIHKSGVCIGYYVNNMRIVIDPCNSALFYGVNVPSFNEIIKRGSIQGRMEILKRYTRWIDDCVKSLKYIINLQDSVFIKTEIVEVGYSIEINPDLQKIASEVVQDYLIPVLTLPDSLGGKKMKGIVFARIKLNSTGKLLCWFPMSILIVEDPESEAIAYQDGPPELPGEQGIVKRFTPWIGECINRIKFDLDRRHPVFKEKNEINFQIGFNINTNESVKKKDGILFDF